MACGPGHEAQFLLPVQHVPVVHMRHGRFHLGAGCEPAREEGEVESISEDHPEERTGSEEVAGDQDLPPSSVVCAKGEHAREQLETVGTSLGVEMKKGLRVRGGSEVVQLPKIVLPLQIAEVGDLAVVGQPDGIVLRAHGKGGPVGEIDNAETVLPRKQLRSSRKPIRSGTR